ncbi:MAG: hypothetical protein KME64_35660 [Scytonematopsis contorta HA4267-MV1]|jgi:hypothetical protein|nr:hypothetical protein [Scytonematopsis contorta HA4267-MV1]
MAVQSSKARVFALVSGNLTGAKMASIFVNALGSIKQIAINQPAPFIAKVYKDSTVEIWKNWS